jgi:hypothetical protein
MRETKSYLAKRPNVTPGRPIHEPDKNAVPVREKGQEGDSNVAPSHQLRGPSLVNSRKRGKDPLVTRTAIKFSDSDGQRSDTEIHQPPNSVAKFDADGKEQRNNETWGSPHELPSSIFPHPVTRENSIGGETVQLLLQSKQGDG